MYRVIWVGKDRKMLEEITKTTSWRKLGFLLTAACGDGCSAVEEIRRQNPDAVLTDICLEGVGGFTLPEFIHRYYPSVMMVILSEKNDLQSLQKAIRLQVQDYLVTPASDGEMDEMLLRLAEALRRKEAWEESQRVLRKKAADGAAAARDRLFQMVYRSQPTEEELRSVARMAGLPQETGSYCVIMCRTQDFPRRYAVLREMDEQSRILAKGADGCTFGRLDDRRTAFLIRGDNDGEVQTRANSVAVAVAEGVRRICGYGVRIGVSACHCTLEFLHEAFQEAEWLLGFGLSANEEVIFSFQAQLRGWKMQTADGLPDDRDICRALYQQGQEEAEHQLDLLFNGIRQRGLHEDICIPIIQKTYLILYYSMLTELWEDAPRMPCGDDWFWMDEAEKCLRDIVRYIVQHQDEEKDDPAARYVRMAKDYIGKHYGDSDLALTEVLQHINTSKSYFSMVFKQKTGMTFVEYLTSVRMEHARELLLNTDLKAYEIAGRVGYANPHYFSLSFRRSTGKTLTEFREENRRVV